MDAKTPESDSNGYISSNPLFRSLTAEEVREFQDHARQNYLPGSPINAVWHPVYRFECLKMNDEATTEQQENRHAQK